MSGTKENKEVKKEIKDINFEKKYKYLLADMENLRKRFEQDKQEIIKYRASGFLTEIIPTLDMFEIALNTKDVPKEVKNWLMGFEMVYKNMRNIIENEGVVRIKVKPGDTFNALEHFAIEEQESEKIQPGEILKVNLDGYKLHDRLLRPTTVVVAKEKKHNKGE